VPWFWGRFKGFTFYPFIFFKEKKEDVSEILFRHEWEHVKQVRELGWFKLSFNYLKESVRVGYKRNKFEVAAYAVQDIPLTPYQKRIFELGREP
jgi:hypothetical protein